MKRIVITGLGALTPIGIGAEAFHKAQLEGQSGVGTISHFDASELSCQIAGEVKADINTWLDKKQQNFITCIFSSRRKNIMVSQVYSKVHSSLSFKFWSLLLV